MDIEEMNKVLSPWRIEIVCENCQRKVEHSSQKLPQLPEPTPHHDGPHTEKKQSQRASKTLGSYSHSKGGKTSQGPHRATESTQKQRRPHLPSHPGPIVQLPKEKPLPRPPAPFNPPNLFLNLNYHSQDPARRISIQDLLESSRNTPNKIEDIDPERFYYSEKKEGVYRGQASQSTAQQQLFVPDESPISYRAKFRSQKMETPVYGRLALDSGASRDASPAPFRPIFHRGLDTPSYLDQTPNNALQFTPNMRGVDQLDETQPDNFNLLAYPFEKSG